MILTDTHAHLYLEQFDEDRDGMVGRAIKQGVNYLFLPNIDSGSIGPMLQLVGSYPGNCFPMMGLHPTSVKENYLHELAIVREHLQEGKFCAIGEMGIDLYWDRTFFAEQQDAFRFQARLALEYDLPIVIHARNSFDEIFLLLEEFRNDSLKGVFHCFTGNQAQANHILSLGFKLGIGGVLTYKKSGLKEVVKEIPMESILLETDAPFLAPVPYRGKRNESAYILEIATELAETRQMSLEEVAAITTENALALFQPLK
jgi:TatD DNase family protein